jgi:glucokinase
MEDSVVLGVDIGGSHITAGAVNLESKTFIENSIKRLKVKSDDTADNIIKSWASLIISIANEHPINKIGIALPGPFDYENGISFITGLQKYESLYGKNVKTLLAKALDIPYQNIKMKNDAGCFLQGEIFAGKAQGYSRSIGLTIGTGIGTASATDGIAEDAALWQAPLKNSIAEDYLSTRWFLKRYAERTGKQAKDVKQLCSLLESEPTVQFIFDEFAENLAEFIAYFANKNNPDVVIIGGNIANASDLFLPQVIAKLANHSIKIPIQKSLLGESAVLLGSASLWREQLLFSK